MAGLVVPPVRLVLWRAVHNDHGEPCHGLTEAGARYSVVHLDATSMDTETMVHELAHVIAERVVSPKAGGHNRVWATIYGVPGPRVLEVDAPAFGQSVRCVTKCCPHGSDENARRYS